MKLNIFCNISARRAESNMSGAMLTFPEFTAGDKVRLGIRFVEQLDNSRFERKLGVKAARLSLGVVAAQPNAGTFRLKVGLDARSSSNTTPPLPANILGAALAASLEALPVVSGTLLSPVRVEQLGAEYKITFGNGVMTSLSTEDNTLEPLSFVRIRQTDSGGMYSTNLRLLQAPLASTNVFQRVVPPAPSVETLQEGSGADSVDSVLIPEVQKITVPSMFRGTWQLHYNNTYASKILGTMETTDSIKEAIEGLFASLKYSVSVVQEIDNEFLVIFDGAKCVGVNVGEMTAAVFNAPEGDVTFDLDLNTREIFAALAKNNLREDCVLELEADVVHDGENAMDPEAPYSTVTLLQAPVILRSELQWSSLGTTNEIDWIRPPTRETYTPFTPDQILTGQQQAYQTVVGDGKIFIIDHNLNRAICSVVVREIDTGRMMRDDEYAVVFSSNNYLTIEFSDELDANSAAIEVVAVGPASVFQTHTHTIEQVVGLPATLEALSGRVKDLEDVIAISPAINTGETWSSEIILSPTVAVFPPSITRKGKEALPALPRALAFASPTTISGIEALPDPTTNAGAIYQWPTPYGDYAESGIYMPGNSFRKGRIVKPWETDYFFCDGYGWWLGGDVRGGTIYPTEMNRVLWEMIITADMLTAGRALTVDFSVLLALVSDIPSIRGECVLRVRKGALSPNSSLSPDGGRLKQIDWDQSGGVEEFFGTTKIGLTRSGMIHGFRTRISKNEEGTLQAWYSAYGKQTVTVAPKSGSFVLRAELAAFDIEDFANPTGYPWGQVYALCAPGTWSADKENVEASKISARFLDAGGKQSESGLMLRATIN